MSYADHIIIDGVQYDIRDAEAVSFEQEQTLTDAQKEQARANIGAGSEADVVELKSAFDDYVFDYKQDWNVPYELGGISNNGEDVEGTNTIRSIGIYIVPKDTTFYVNNFHVRFFVYNQEDEYSAKTDYIINSTYSFSKGTRIRMQAYGATFVSVITDIAPFVHAVSVKNDVYFLNENVGALQDNVSNIEDIIQQSGIKTTVRVGVGRDYTSILTAMMTIDADNIVYLLDGETFDLTAEYKAVYGNSFFENYQASDYTSTDIYKKGLTLRNGVEIIGMANTRIVFDNSNGNSYSKMYFSPLNLTMNNRVENIEIEISNDDARYHIHDDFSKSLKGTNIIKNCVFIGRPEETGCIGGGMGHGCTYIVDGCRFMSGNTYSMYYHASQSSGAKNKVIVSGCYCATNLPITLLKYGQGTDVTDAYVYNNKGNTLLTVHPYDTWGNNNIALYEWNNAPIT